MIVFSKPDFFMFSPILACYILSLPEIPLPIFLLILISLINDLLESHLLDAYSWILSAKSKIVSVSFEFLKPFVILIVNKVLLNGDLWDVKRNSFWKYLNEKGTLRE
jgi:hypothetical protein